MKKIINNLILSIGIILVAAAVIFSVFSILREKSAAENTKNIVSKIYDTIPEISKGFVDDITNKSMPVAEIDGMNFVGIIEIPLYETELPVYSSWDKSKVKDFPCRYMGSIYENNLVIGGVDNKDQFDFMKRISVSDTVYVTDMTGAEFTYKVSDIIITDDVSTESLKNEAADLTIFAPNSTSFNYTVVYCELN